MLRKGQMDATRKKIQSPVVHILDSQSLFFGGNIDPKA